MSERAALSSLPADVTTLQASIIENKVKFEHLVGRLMNDKFAEATRADNAEAYGRKLYDEGSKLQGHLSAAQNNIKDQVAKINGLELEVTSLTTERDDYKGRCANMAAAAPSAQWVSIGDAKAKYAEILKQTASRYTGELSARDAKVNELEQTVAELRQIIKDSLADEQPQDQQGPTIEEVHDADWIGSPLLDDLSLIHI